MAKPVAASNGPARRAVRPARRLVLRLPRAHVASETATHAPMDAFHMLRKLVFMSSPPRFFGAPKSGQWQKLDAA
jgi:hypothetical protein